MCEEPQFTHINILELRAERQKLNNSKVNDLLMGDTLTKKILEKECNPKELDRMMNDISGQLKRPFTFEEFHTKCKGDDIYRLTVGPRIAKNCSRQGCKDELTVLTVCDNSTSKHGTNIEPLPNDSIRAHKHSSKLINKDEYKKGKGDYKQNDCLKSFDAKVCGKKQGWITAKVCIGSGGHQDNVFEEAHCFGEWADKYGEQGKLYIILIDTDLTNKFKELEEKYKDNSKVYVVDHIGLQKLLIN
jgi:macrodomain Ter protein organizer (MatP/YcbG family)